MNAYSTDLRERVVQAVLSGLSRREVTRTFGVSLSSLKRWLVLHHQSAGNLSPKPHPGKPRRLTLQAEPLLRAQLQAHPDATLEEHVQRWHKEQQQEHDTPLGRATMARAIRRVGYTRKKRA